MEENESKAARERLPLVRLYEELRGLGFEGSYAAVRRYAIAWREKRVSATANAFVHGLLLERHTGRRRLREHDGQVATIRSNVRWCSDGLEFTCWNGEVVRVAFALDCHDREVIACGDNRRHLGRDDPRHDGALRRATL